MGVSGHLLIGREPAVWPSFCQPTVRLADSLVEGISLLAGTVRRRGRGVRRAMPTEPCPSPVTHTAAAFRGL